MFKHGGSAEDFSWSRPASGNGCIRVSPSEYLLSRRFARDVFHVASFGSCSTLDLQIESKDADEISGHAFWRPM